MDPYTWPETADNITDFPAGRVGRDHRKGVHEARREMAPLPGKGTGPSP